MVNSLGVLSSRRLRAVILATCVCVVSFAVCESSHGGIVATITPVAPASLGNNATAQKLEVYLHSDAGVVNDVGGINLTATLGDGTNIQPGVPKFETFVWDPTFTANLPLKDVSQVPVVGNDFLAVASAAGLGTFATIGTTPTLIGTYDIDTTGIFDQVFNFTIGSFLGGTSDVNSISLDPLDATPFVFTGTFNVGTPAPVPEPSTFALLGLGGLGLVIRQHRRKSAVAVQAS